MAARKKNKGLTREQLWKIWAQVGTHNWLDIASSYKRSHNFTHAGRDILKGLCVHPDHSDTDPSFFIYTGKGFAKCFGCGYYVSNPLELLSLFMEAPEAEALQHLKEKFGLSFLPKKALAELEAQRRNLLMKEEIYRVTHNYMCDALADPDKKEHKVAKNAINWLVNARQIPKDTLHALPIGVMPELARLQEIILKRFKREHEKWQQTAGNKPEPQNLADPAFEYFKNYIRGTTFAGSILFPLHVNPKEIGRLKLRAPNNNKEFTIPDDDFEDLLGLFGLGWNQYHSFMDPKADVDFAYLTEGEIDVLSVMARFAQQGKAKYPLFSVGGRGGAAHIEPILVSSGISKAFLVGDAPSKKGNEIVQSWLEKIIKLNTRIFTGWDKMIGCGDIDEAVVKLGEGQVSKVLWQTFGDNFTTAWNWAFERASVELEAIPEHDYRNLVEHAAEHGKYLRDQLECEKFAQVVGDAYNINPSILKRQIASREESENGFIMRCTDALKELLFVVGTETSGGNRYLVLYDKRNKRFNRVKLDSEQSLAQELAPIVGTLFDFVTEHVGFPSFLQMPDDSEGLVRPKLDRQLRYYVREAVQSLARGAPDFMSSRQYRQGYHCVELPTRQLAEYIVCGADVFAVRRDDGHNTIYEQLEGPSDNGIIFDVGIKGNVEEPWFPGGLSVKKLDDGKNADLKKLYNDLVHLFDIGYKFKNQDITTKLLAALMLAYPTMDAFERPLLMFVTGDTSSGKTSLLSTFSGLGYGQIRLLHASQGTENYTAASVASMCNCNSLLLALDEFESTDNRTGEEVRKILEMVRPLISGEARRVRGRPDGTHYESILRMPIIFSAIQGAERPQDLNRMLIVEMKKIAGKNSPVTVILDEFGEARIEEMGREIATAMYPHALTLAQHEKDIRHEFRELQTSLPFTVEWRFASSLYSALAVMKFLDIEDLDWKTFFREYVISNESTILRATTISESESYLNAMLYNPVIFQREDNINVAVAQLLISPEKRAEINTAACGVYFDEEKELLLMLLDQAVPRLLPNHLKTRGMSGSRLKDTLERHRAALPQKEVQRSNILRKVGPYLGAGIKLQDVVVFRAQEWLSSAEEALNDAVKEAEEEREAHAGETEETHDSGETEPTKQAKDASDHDW